MNNDAPSKTKCATVDIFGREFDRVKFNAMAIAALFVVTLGMFADVLFTTQDIVLGDPTTDVVVYYMHWRKFGFEELLRGNLALWNPHIYSGEPFFGMFQAALLYPPNLIYLVLPLAKAINTEIALHIFAGGALMYWWALRRGLHPLSCFLCALLWMFCGPHWLHLSSGHLTHLSSMIWTPLLFLAIDECLQKPSLKWALAGMWAVAMQILAGHPQFFFVSAVAAALYAGLRLIQAERKVKVAVTLATIYLGGFSLGAIQLLPGLEAAGETVRSTGMPVAEAGGFSFPPENILTFLAPGFFGNNTMEDYFGRWFYWEMSGFFSVTGLVFAVLGLFGSRHAGRWICGIVAAVLFVFALARYTPLFPLLYEYLPGFDKFRAHTRFLAVSLLFSILLAGMGFDTLWERKALSRWFRWGVFGLGVLAVLGSFAIVSPASGKPSRLWEKSLVAMRETKESFLSPPTYESPDFIAKSSRQASKSLMLAAFTLFAVALVLTLAARRPAFSAGILLLASIEMLIFARVWRDTFTLQQVDVPPLRNFLREQTGDFRTMNLLNANMSMSLGSYDIWGDDAAVMRRYAEFIAFTQGLPPAEATQRLDLRKIDPLYRMLRCRFVIIPKPGKKLETQELANPLPRFLLLNQFRVLPNRDAIFSAMKESSFDPAKEVLLETKPFPEPSVATGADTATNVIRLLDSSTDYFTIEVESAANSILLITDAFSKNWRARNTGGDQRGYEIIPANYCLQAVALSAGRHSIRFEYLPQAFVIGKWISIAACLVYVPLLALVVFKMRKPSANSSETAA